MIKRYFIIAGLLIGFFHHQASASDSDHLVTGTVYGIEQHADHQDTVALANANILWKNTTIGTITNSQGTFQLAPPDSVAQLIVSYIGFENDTLVVHPHDHSLTVFLDVIRSTEEVAVVAEKPHTIQHTEEVVNRHSITETGLQTLACCNLAESFENSAAVDVEQTDAISGAKRIKMLGLAGTYTQMMVEKVPSMRGLIAPYGLEYIPGYWIEAIDISKGTASVANGYESITGQINVELKKPQSERGLNFNGYQNSMGRSEMTVTANEQLSPTVSTMLLTFASYNQTKWDVNGDTFLDMPLTTHFNIINRWKYKGENKEGQIGVKFLHDDRHGGQMSFDFSNPGTTTAYGSDMRTQRLEFFSKGGLALNSSSSVGLIFSAFRHKLDSFWGRKNYAGDESSLFTNLLFETTVRRHSFSSGLSYTLTARDETYMRTLYETNESVPGAFIEYTWRMNDRLTAMLGWRYDWHNLYGAFSTPRMHLKYDEGTTSLRLSLGKGYRVPHIFMDNPAILTSSRELLVSQPLRTEEAWNAGLQIVKDFRIAADRPASLSLDFYRTVFVQQVVVDMEQHPQQIWLYNLNGRSFSNSAQIELNLSAARGLDLTSAYRFNDVRTTYQQWLQKVPLTAAHKGLFVISYTLPADTWQFDITTQFNGKSRLPNGHMNPEFQREAYSPSYILLFTQVTRKFAKWELYAGVENITDYRQPNPVLGWNDPFGPTFDSSILWGPTIGRRLYVGIRTN